METMLNFKRLAELTRDVPAIVAAIRLSKAGLIEVSRASYRCFTLTFHPDLPPRLINPTCHLYVLP